MERFSRWLLLAQVSTRILAGRFCTSHPIQAARSPQNQSVIIILNQNPPSANHLNSAKKDTIQPYHTAQLVLPNPNYKTRSRFYQSLFLGGIFLIAFLVFNFLLKPFTNAWTLIFLTILLPFPFLVIPSLFDLKLFATFSSLIFGIGLGAFSLFLLL